MSFWAGLGVAVQAGIVKIPPPKADYPSICLLSLPDKVILLHCGLAANDHFNQEQEEALTF